MVLITGATGTVGKEVVKRLSAQNIRVRAVTRGLRRAEATPLPHCEFVQGDFNDPDSLTGLFTAVGTTDWRFVLFGRVFDRLNHRFEIGREPMTSAFGRGRHLTIS